MSRAGGGESKVGGGKYNGSEGRGRRKVGRARGGSSKIGGGKCNRAEGWRRREIGMEVEGGGRGQ